MLMTVALLFLAASVIVSAATVLAAVAMAGRTAMEPELEEEPIRTSTRGRPFPVDASMNLR